MNPLENIINFLKLKDELHTAHTLLTTFEKYSNSLQELDILGKLMNEVKDYPSAIRVTEKALLLATSPEESYSIRCNLIKLLNETNEPKKALRLIKANLAIFPDDFSMLMEANFSYFLLNEKDKSEETLRSLLETPNLTPEQISKIKFNLGTYDLEHGKFQEGLKGFIQEGKKIGIWPDDKIPFNKRVKSSEDFKSNSILIQADGGIGDEIINIRFLKNKDSITWLTHRKDLAEIFSNSGFKTVTSANPDDYDKITTSMQLPIWLNSTEESLWQGRYLEPSDEAYQKFQYMSNSPKLKIGLRWSGNPYYEQNLHRSLDFDSLYNVVKSKYPNAELYSLQFPRDTSVDYKDVIDMSEEIESFDDTLAIIDNLDIIITSCTSIAHAAGALDKKTIVFVPISAYYTWISPHSSRESSESIWYSKNLKVLRQDEPKTWSNQLMNLLDLL